jgi:hypothetical protein
MLTGDDAIVGGGVRRSAPEAATADASAAATEGILPAGPRREDAPQSRRPKPAGVALREGRRGPHRETRRTVLS